MCGWGRRRCCGSEVIYHKRLSIRVTETTDEAGEWTARDEQPTTFWVAVAIYYVLAGLMLIGAISLYGA